MLSLTWLCACNVVELKQICTTINKISLFLQCSTSCWHSATAAAGERPCRCGSPRGRVSLLHQMIPRVCPSLQHKHSWMDFHGFYFNPCFTQSPVRVVAVHEKGNVHPKKLKRRHCLVALTLMESRKKFCFVYKMYPPISFLKAVCLYKTQCVSEGGLCLCRCTWTVVCCICFFLCRFLIHLFSDFIFSWTSAYSCQQIKWFKYM